MINKLKFTVTFTSTGKAISDEHTFNTGLTSISGANEVGKSLRLEFIRFALFGTKALRGDIKSYSKLDVTLETVIKEVVYTINRTINKATITSNNIVLVSGVTPVNAFINNLLGYSLEVFDIGNACLQGQVEALTDKKPTERKRIIDKLIGLDGIDRVLAKVKTRVSNAETENKTLESLLPTSMEIPTKPSLTLITCEENAKQLKTNLEINKLRYKEITTTLSILKCLAPQEIAIEEIEFSEKELQDQINVAYNLMITANSKKADILKWEKASSEIKQYLDLKLDILRFKNENYTKKWSDYNSYIKNEISKPKVELVYIDELEQYSKDLDYNNSTTKNINCPHCKGEIKLSLLGNEIIQPIDLIQKYPNLEIPEKIILSKFIKEVRLEHELYNLFISKPKVEKPDLDYRLENLLYLISNFEFVDSYNPKADLEQIEICKDEYTMIQETNSEFILKIRQNEKIKHQYNQELEKYTKYNNYLTQVTNEIEILTKDLSTEETLEKELEEFKNYSILQTKYQHNLNLRNDLENKISVSKTKLFNLNSIKTVLIALKPKIKLYIIPSLSLVASRLLESMSNNKRQQVKIDDDFNIYIDDQEICELSGSAKALANLAIRLGLGMVLTNKTYSILLTDELDASMDDERSNSTIEALRNLAINKISQIILISHKDIEADHQILL